MCSDVRHDRDSSGTGSFSAAEPRRPDMFWPDCFARIYPYRCTPRQMPLSTCFSAVVCHGSLRVLNQMPHLRERSPSSFSSSMFCVITNVREMPLARVLTDRVGSLYIFHCPFCGSTINGRCYCREL